MTLRLRIMGATLSLILASGLATVAAMYLLLSHQLKAELIKRGESIARHVAVTGLTPVLTEDVVTLQLNLTEAMRSEEDIRYIFFVDSEGQVTAHSFRDGFPAGLRDANASRADGARTVPLLVGDETVYDIAVPVGEGRLGAVRLGLSAASVAAGVRNFLGVGTALILGIVAVVGAVAVFLDHRVTDPVSRLTRTVGEISKGKLDKRVDVTTGDEIGELAASFNQMMERIEASRKELVDLNSSLEREIAERIEAETTVREQETELKAIFENTTVTMALIDGRGALRRLNRSFPSAVRPGAGGGIPASLGGALGCVAAVRRGGKCGAARECESCNMCRTVRDTLASRTAHRQVEVTLDVQDPGGGERKGHFLISSAPIAIRGQELALVSVEDVTPLKEAQIGLVEAYGELENQNEELKKLDVIKSSLIRDVTHELKTPVAKFVMQVEMLRSQLDSSAMPGSWKVSLDRMEKNLRRQEAVIRNLLDLARLESGRRTYKLEPLRLDLLLEEVIEDYSIIMASKGLSAVSRLEPAEITSDREMLWHVFSNLMSNAVKFSEKGAGETIRVALEENGDGWVARVADGGAGLSPGEKQKAFDLFYQSSASVEGMGVGLALCRSLLEGLGGSVELDSPGKGRGTVASVHLPREAPRRS